MPGEDGVWRPVRRDGYDGRHDWEFRHTNTLVLDNGYAVCFGGFSTPYACHETGEFIYIPSGKLLYVITRDIFCNADAGSVDIYLVERMDRTYFRLYPVDMSIRILAGNLTLR